MPDSEILHVSRHPDDASFPGGMGGQALTVDLSLGGRALTFLNGGPQHPLTAAVSIVLQVDGQAEIDRLWEGLLAGGGSESRCGWLVDAHGLSWQIVPSTMGELMSGPHAGAVSQALMGMTRIHVAALERAHPGA